MRGGVERGLTVVAGGVTGRIWGRRGGRKELRSVEVCGELGWIGDDAQHAAHRDESGSCAMVHAFCFLQGSERGTVVKEGLWLGGKSYAWRGVGKRCSNGRHEEVKRKLNRKQDGETGVKPAV